MTLEAIPRFVSDVWGGEKSSPAEAMLPAGNRAGDTVASDAIGRTVPKTPASESEERDAGDRSARLLMLAEKPYQRPLREDRSFDSRWQLEPEAFK